MKSFLTHTLAALVLAAPAGQAAAQAATQDCNGIVTIERKGADVIVTGDDGDNCIHLFDKTGQGDNVTLLTFGGTRLAEDTEGATDGIWIVLPDPEDVRVDLGKGNDRLEAMDVHRPDIRWNVLGGEGDDLLAFGTMTLGKLVVRAGRGNDTGSFYDVTAKRVRFAAAGGADSIFATDEIPANLKARGVELPAAPPPGCPIAEETIEGFVLLGTNELDVSQCNVKKELSGTEKSLWGELYGFSTKTGDYFGYTLIIDTPAGLSVLPTVPLNEVATIDNISTRESVVDLGRFFKTPRYMIEGLMDCYDLLIAACPDHLNHFGGVKDTGPGISGDDGLPL